MSMARPSKPTANFRRVRAGPTMFLLFGRAYPDLTIAKDYGAHVLNLLLDRLLINSIILQANQANKQQYY